jgi:hypothetical protein
MCSFLEDVILEIDGYPVANNGTVRFFKEYRTDATVIVHQHFVGMLYFVSNSFSNSEFQKKTFFNR